MAYGICGLSAVPMRAEASDKAEMINQLVFGEAFELLEVQTKWSFVKLMHDGYEGWVDNKQIVSIDDRSYRALEKQKAVTTADLIDLVSDNTKGRGFPIFLGSLLPFFKDSKFTIGQHALEFEGSVTTSQKDRETLVDFAYKYLDAPYLWGGRTPAGIDCSGFTQMVYRLAGYSLPRDSGQQAQLGSTLSFIEESEPGDLAFFDNEEGVIMHVGILLKDNKIIHASGQVRIDELDQSGIFNKEIQRHTHRLRVIKKVI